MSICRNARRRATILWAVPLAVALAACGGSAPNEAGGAGEPIRIGVPTSLTGVFGTYGEMIREGLAAGLHCSTNGTNTVDGRPIEFVFADDGGEAAQALTAATGMIGDGINIIAGTTSSGISLQLGEFAAQQDVLFISGAAGTDQITGLNDNAFRSSRQARQEAAALSSVLPQSNGKVVVLAQDYAFGQGYVDTITEILGTAGAEVQPILVPLDANEFTLPARQIIEAAPDLLVVVYYGDTAAAMWQSLQQQGVLDATTVATLLVEKTNWPIYGPGAGQITFATHYFPGAPGTAVNDCLVEQVPGADLSTHDGFVTAQMAVHAITEAGPDDVPGMIAALEGWTFEAPKGQMTIRAEDHAMLQDMYLVSLTDQGGQLTAKAVGTAPADAVAP